MIVPPLSSSRVLERIKLCTSTKEISEVEIVLQAKYYEKISMEFSLVENDSWKTRLKWSNHLFKIISHVEKPQIHKSIILTADQLTMSKMKEVVVSLLFRQR